MANGISETYSKIYTGYLLGNTLQVPNTGGNIYLGISTTIPAADGSNFTEVTDVSYERVEIPVATSSWTVANDKVIKNAKSFLFSDVDTEIDQIVAWGLYDASTGGNMFMWGTLKTPIRIKAGGGFYFPAHALEIYNDNSASTSPKGLLWANGQLNLLRGESVTPITHVYLGLGNKTPKIQAGGDIDFGEFSYPTYARVPIPVGSAEWEYDAVATRMIKNINEHRFVDDPASPDLVSQVQDVEWDIRSYAVFDSSSATHPLYAENLGDDAIAYDQDIPRIKAGKLQITE